MALIKSCLRWLGNWVRMRSHQLREKWVAFVSKKPLHSLVLNILAFKVLVHIAAPPNSSIMGWARKIWVNAGDPTNGVAHHLTINAIEPFSVKENVTWGSWVVIWGFMYRDVTRIYRTQCIWHSKMGLKLLHCPLFLQSSHWELDPQWGQSFDCYSTNSCQTAAYGWLALS